MVKNAKNCFYRRNIINCENDATKFHKIMNNLIGKSIEAKYPQYECDKVWRMILEITLWRK